MSEIIRQSVFDKMAMERERNINDPRRAVLKNIVKEKGLLWAISAMVDGSIGYHSPRSAEIRIRQLMSDQYVFGCERSSACFEGDSISEIEADFRYFKEDHPEKAKRIMEFVEKVAKLSDIDQLGVGLLYPTLIILEDWVGWS